MDLLNYAANQGARTGAVKTVGDVSSAIAGAKGQRILFGPRGGNSKITPDHAVYPSGSHLFTGDRLRFKAITSIAPARTGVALRSIASKTTADITAPIFNSSPDQRTQ